MYPNYWQQQYQQTQPNIYRPTIPGRVVNALEEITPNDVPMDGSAGLFLLRDMSAVYAKAWKSDGTISTVRYVPEIQPEQVAKPDPMSIILERLDKIEELVTRKPNFNKPHEKEVKTSVQS